MPRISLEFSLGAVLTLVLYVLDKTGKSNVYINFIMLLAISGLCLHAGLSIPWVWTPLSAAWKAWRAGLVASIVLLAVSAFGIWALSEKKAVAAQSAGAPADAKAQEGGAEKKAEGKKQEGDKKDTVPSDATSTVRGQIAQTL
jgi:hypothetical protein